MTARELYLRAKAQLTKAGVDSPGFDAARLSERFLGLDRSELALQGDEAPDEKKRQEFLEAVSQRAERRPLQYILGEWPFMSLTLSVGEGVLVPREDTAALVEALAAWIGEGARGLDLCAGSGAVGLGICSIVPGAQVICVELDEKAGEFLDRNIARYPRYDCRAAAGDVLRGPEQGVFPKGLDFIASNPPYIATGELSALQPEVQKEPSLALDGGGDGLTFYRAILEKWAPLLRPGGALGVEIGDTQAREVTELFARSGFVDITVHKDLAGLDRAVTAAKGSTV